ncbi:hypothetical protein [Thiorhodococcus minor]|uniref:hypothetical protein n=1 Tax=Thiorhodococcus minor TaxID=57489 RepID=UPI001ADD3385|nr:hypothetical protein [Thiorhodococcus minor]
MPLLAALALAASPIHAELVEGGFQVVITMAGHDCAAIERTQPIATLASGDTLVGVACKGGDRYVVRIHKDNSISYMTPCSELKSRTGISCFGSR